MQMQATTSRPASARPKSLSQDFLDGNHSAPLRAAQVPQAGMLSDEQLIATYLAEGVAAEADCYWYFRPWQWTSPRKSGVYVRRQRNGYVGFAYYDADAHIWLYTHDTLAQAQRFADQYHAEPSPVRRYLRFHSNSQSVQWSAASVCGLEDLDFSRMREGPGPSDDAQIRLAMLRWVMDPQRKRRNFGG